MSEGDGLDIGVSEEANTTVLHLTGYVDLRTRPLLWQVASCAFACGADQLAIECANVDFADASLVRIVVDLRAASGGRSVRVEHAPRSVRRMFEIVDVPLRCPQEPTGERGWPTPVRGTGPAWVSSSGSSPPPS